MAHKISPTDITRYYKFADEDRESAFEAAAEGDWDAYDRLMHCARTHERTARDFGHQWICENRPS